MNKCLGFGLLLVAVVALSLGINTLLAGPVGLQGGSEIPDGGIWGLNSSDGSGIFDGGRLVIRKSDAFVNMDNRSLKFDRQGGNLIGDGHASPPDSDLVIQMFKSDSPFKRWYLVHALDHQRRARAVSWGEATLTR